MFRQHEIGIWSTYFHFFFPIKSEKKKSIYTHFSKYAKSSKALFANVPTAVLICVER